MSPQVAPKARTTLDLGGTEARAHYLNGESSEAESESSLRRASFQKGCCRTPSQDNLGNTVAQLGKETLT